MKEPEFDRLSSVASMLYNYGLPKMICPTSIGTISLQKFSLYEEKRMGQDTVGRLGLMLYLPKPLDMVEGGRLVLILNCGQY